MPTNIRIDTAPSPADLMLIAADFAVLELVLVDVLEAVVVLPVPVTSPVVFVPLSVLVRTGSSTNEALRPLTFLHWLFGVPTPETKLTAAHWKSYEDACYTAGLGRNREADLVQDSIRSVLHNPDNALLARPGRRHRNRRLAKCAQASLLNDGEQLGPVICVLVSAEHAAEQPIRLRVDGRDSNFAAADVEVGHIVLAEIDCVAPAGSGGLERVVEANGRRIVEQEVRRGEGS